MEEIAKYQTEYLETSGTTKEGKTHTGEREKSSRQRRRKRADADRYEKGYNGRRRNYEKKEDVLPVWS